MSEKAPNRIFWRFKRSADFLQKNNKINLFNETLEWFVPNWNLKDIESEFILKAKGSGASNLNIYRKTKINNNYYFEKIYFSQSNVLKNILWFYDYIYPLVKEDINLTPIYKTFTGDILTIVYFEYLYIEKEIKTEAGDLVKIAKTLYSLSLREDIEILIKEAPERMKDLNNYYYFNENYQTSSSLLSKLGVNHYKIKTKMDVSRKLLTHTDIIERNLYAESFLMDWDDFGVYPIGFDVANIYKSLYLKVDYENPPSPIKWLTNNYQSLQLKENEWLELELNFVYLLFVFSFQELQLRNKEVKKELVEYLKNYSAT